MRFLSIFRSPETGVPPTADEMTRMGALIEKFSRSGHLLSTEGCLPSRLGFRVRRDDGKVTVTDGPFTEAKEVVGGFAILQADSKEEAIALTEEFLSVVGGGECEGGSSTKCRRWRPERARVGIEGSTIGVRSVHLTQWFAPTGVRTMR